MNQVKTYIDKSSIEGIGLFAAEFIPKGTLIWKFSGIDTKYSKDEIESLHLSELENAYFKRYEFNNSEVFILCGDDARFCNHSNTPNTLSTFFHQYASEDIDVGQEITCDYRSINKHFNEQEFNELVSNKPKTLPYPYYAA